MRRTTFTRLVLVLVPVVAAAVVGASWTSAANDRARTPALEFLGQQIIPTGAQFEGTEIGGLSGMAYDAERDVFYALSDDQGQIDPVRFYTLRLDLADGSLDAGDIDFLDVTTLLEPNGQPFVTASADPEGLALTKDDELVVTSEGFAARLIDPFVRRFALDGSSLGALPVPTPFLPATGTRGVRQNLGFESAATAPNGRFLFTGTEAALVQDGPPATLAAGSPARILRYNLQTGTLDRQYLYWVDPIAEPPVPATNFAVAGTRGAAAAEQPVPALHGALVLGRRAGHRQLDQALSSRPGRGRQHQRRGQPRRASDVDAAEKTLLLDLDTLGIPLDNVEAMAFGPDLPDGRRSLILVSDNNFAPAQFTQFLLFAVSPG